MAGITVQSRGVQQARAPEGPLLTGGGDNVDAIALEAPTVGQLRDIRRGTSSTPDASLNPPFKVSRTVSYNAVGNGFWQGVADANSCAIAGHAVGTATNQAQIIGVLGAVKQQGTSTGTNATGGLASPDAVGLEGYALVPATAVGAAIGLVGIAHNNSATGKQVANAAQLFIYNDTGTDSTVVTNGQALARGISLYSYGANLGGIGLEVVGPVGGTGNQFDVGVHFPGHTSGAFTGGIKTAAIQDDSTAATSIQINGSRTNGIVLNGTNSTAGIALGVNAGGLVIGALTPVTGAMLDVRAPNSVVRNLCQVGNTANAQTYAIKVLSSEGQLEAGVGHTAILTGMAAGDVYARPATASTFLHLGGTSSVVKVGNANTLGFFNATAVAQQSAVGTATGYTAGATAATFHSDDTYTGGTGTTAYTINGVVAALKNYGLLAA